MSAVITSAAAENTQLRTAKPSFFGLVRGEFLKVMRQWNTWILLALLLVVTVLPYIVETVRPRFKEAIASAPSVAYYDQMGIGLSVLRVFTGFFLLIVTARMIGQEYQLGTIRVLLSRGVGVPAACAPLALRRSSYSPATFLTMARLTFLLPAAYPCSIELWPSTLTRRGIPALRATR